MRSLDFNKHTSTSLGSVYEEDLGFHVNFFGLLILHLFILSVTVFVVVLGLGNDTSHIFSIRVIIHLYVTIISSVEVFKISNLLIISRRHSLLSASSKDSFHFVRSFIISGLSNKKLGNISRHSFLDEIMLFSSNLFSFGLFSIGVRSIRNGSEFSNNLIFFYFSKLNLTERSNLDSAGWNVLDL